MEAVMMSEKTDVRNRIIYLLESASDSLSVYEIGLYLGDTSGIINLSLASLLREGKISIETKEGRNFFSKASDDPSLEQGSSVNWAMAPA
jgi:predicted transcriptional regulator